MERETCQKCGNPLIEVIPGQLLRCPVCLCYRRLREPNESASLNTAQTPGTVKESLISSLGGEMKVFAERVIYTLCPVEKGYAPVIVKEVRSIYDVLEGKKDFSEWFTNVRQKLSIKSYQLAQVLHDSLKGLRSEEARELRQQWQGYLETELKGYGIA